jgi:hypothetical protein
VCNFSKKGHGDTPTILKPKLPYRFSTTRALRIGKPVPLQTLKDIKQKVHGATVNVSYPFADFLFVCISLG